MSRRGIAVWSTIGLMVAGMAGLAGWVFLVRPGQIRVLEPGAVIEQARRDARARDDKPPEPWAPADPWWTRTTIDAFDRARQGQQWPSARRAVVAFARDMSDDPPPTGDETETAIAASATAAVDYGCEDPLVWYARGRALLAADADSDDGAFAMARAGVLFRGDTSYPPIRRCMGLLAGAKAIRTSRLHAHKVPQIKAPEYAAAAVALYPEAVADPATPTADLLRLVRTAGEASAALRGGTDRSLVEPLLEAIAKSKQPRAKVLTARGEYLVRRAWDARGSGFADTVGEAGWQGFHAHLAKAREALEEAWRLDPTEARAAALMVTVAMGGSDEPAEARRWYDRAMAADPTFYNPVERYMLSLEPKWGGSVEQMRAFGQELVRTAVDVGTAQRATALVEAHWTLAGYAGGAGGQPDPAYFARDPAAWDDVRSALETYLKLVPESRYHRTRYAVVAAWAGRWDVAAAQLEALGDGYSRLVVPVATMDAVRARAKRATTGPSVERATTARE